MYCSRGWTNHRSSSDLDRGIGCRTKAHRHGITNAEKYENHDVLR